MGGAVEIVFESGGQLFFRRGQVAGARISQEPPQLLWRGGFTYDDTGPNMRYFGVAPDGRIVIVEAQPPTEASLIVAPHWDLELKRLLPKKAANTGGIDGQTSFAGVHGSLPDLGTGVGAVVADR